MIRLISITILNSSILEIGISRSDELGWRYWITILSLTFDWVGYDYVNRNTEYYGIQKCFRIHLNKYRHWEWRFGKVIKK
jgi:hypothetical protein